VFVPLALTPALHGDRAKWLVLIAAFASWSAVASAGYLANDRFDLVADRADPAKRERPFASGALPLGVGMTAALALAAFGVGLAAAVAPLAFVAHLVVYLALTLAYSLFVKRILLVDVLLLAALYTLRLLAGGAATGIALTPWLLAFSLFFFLSLAFAKRYAEVVAVRHRRRAQSVAARLSRRRSRSADDARHHERLSLRARVLSLHQQRSRGRAVCAPRCALVPGADPLVLGEPDLVPGSARRAAG
jgi:4-hydroxybenzoate polyprenyltransferase